MKKREKKKKQKKKHKTINTKKRIKDATKTMKKN